MDLKFGGIYASRDARILVKVIDIREAEWVEYRKCNGVGELLPRTRAATSRIKSFRRRFPMTHGI